MLTKHKYCPLPDELDEDIQKCCWDDNPDDPKGDCCYETWQDQLDEVNQKYKEADEKAKQLQKQVDSARFMREKVKAWFEDLSKASDLSINVCQQLDIFYSQIKNVCCTTESTQKAIDILYCMVKDFYIRLDELKDDYDDLVACIKCLNNPDVNASILSCLTKYAEKLEAALATRDKLIELLVKAVKLAYEINAVICSKYGLKTVVWEWQVTFACSGTSGGPKGNPKQGNEAGDDDCAPPAEICELDPMLSFPLKDEGGYYGELKTEKTELDTRIDDLNTKLVEANKIKETLMANRDNLIKAIAEVDPKNKCKP